MAKGYSNATGEPLVPPATTGPGRPVTKEDAKAQTFRFGVDVSALFPEKAKTAFLEDAVRLLSWLNSRPDLRDQLATAAFEQIQPLQAVEQYEPEAFRPEMKQQKALLDKLWDRLRTK